MADKDFKYIVRVANTDIDGKKSILYGPTKIKGMGVSFANLVVNTAGVPKGKKLGEATEAEVKKLNDAVMTLQKDAPEWMINRPKDPETGVSHHLLSGELKFAKEQDIRTMRRIKTFRGVRHAAGLPTRGQRTKSNFRKNKGKALGVKKAKSQ